MSSEVSTMFTVIITGLVVVFAVLIILTFLIWGYSKLVSALEGKSQKKSVVVAQKKNEVVPVPAKSEKITNSNEIDDETLAVITAAVEYFSNGFSTKYAIKNIKRVTTGRSAWANAAVLANTRPF